MPVLGRTTLGASADRTTTSFFVLTPLIDLFTCLRSPQSIQDGNPWRIESNHTEAALKQVFSTRALGRQRVAPFLAWWPQSQQLNYWCILWLVYWLPRWSYINEEKTTGCYQILSEDGEQIIHQLFTNKSGCCATYGFDFHASVHELPISLLLAPYSASGAIWWFWSTWTFDYLVYLCIHYIYLFWDHYHCHLIPILLVSFMVYKLSRCICAFSFIFVLHYTRFHWLF